MPPPSDLTGRVFERLEVLGLAPREQWRRDSTSGFPRRSWTCRCACGAIRVVPTAALNNGNSRSCGCLQRDKATATGAWLGRIRHERTCPNCGAPFPGTARQKFCGRPCKEAYDLAPRHPWNCESCGRPFLARRGQRFCRVQCKTRERARPTFAPEAILDAAHKLEEQS